MPTVTTLPSTTTVPPPARSAPHAPDRPTPRHLPAPVVGAELDVPLLGGGRARYVNLDYAASAPCLVAVRDALDRTLPWYASVHRGAGFASTVCTAVLDEARQVIHRFVGARPDDTVVLTRNTTDALNLLATVVPAGTTVISFASEHHANLLPWRHRTHSVLLPVPDSPAAALDAVDRALTDAPAGALVAITGASNVTGELWPVGDLARLVRARGGRLAVDAAQLAPHRPIDLAADGIDWVAFSGHKLYAPFGCGALIGRADWLDEGPPYLAGGGAVRHVSPDATQWAVGPARHEGGTPNVLGAVALAAAAIELDRIGFDAIEAHEAALSRRLHDHLSAIPGIEVHRLWAAADTIGVTALNLRHWHHAHLAAVLSAEHGIGVRDGAFCAHPLTRRLVGDGRAGGERSPGAGRPGRDPGQLRPRDVHRRRRPSGPGVERHRRRRGPGRLPPAGRTVRPVDDDRPRPPLLAGAGPGERPADAPSAPDPAPGVQAGVRRSRGR